ncbi:MAG TPA: hypothetical protein VER32_14045 [Pyrinomonadaceae bacterium]|nr:hypothetical protein [Pyrinomonadaceae bacterium]
MSDYLSQLARASGLRVGRTPSARGATPSAPAHARDARHAARTDAATSSASDEPPHGERVAFVGGARGESSFDVTGDEHARRAPDHEAGGDAEGSARHYARRVGGDGADARQASRGDATRAGGGAEGLARDDASRRAVAATEGGVVTLAGPDETGRDAKTRGARRESLSDAAASAGARASGDDEGAGAAFETTVVVGPRGGVDESLAEGRQAHRGASDAGGLDSSDAGSARRNYMREIVEWISAPSSARADGQESNGRAESSALARAESMRGPEVDDVTLSIGSIHVVVEEPPAQAQARPAASPPTAASSPARADGGDEGSRLRRHYIRL